MSKTSLHHQLSEEVPAVEWLFDYPLANLTYFKLGGPAEAFAKVSSKVELQAIMEFSQKHATPLTVLGGASNVVVADQGITGIVVQWTDDHFSLLDEKISGKHLVEAGAGIKTAMLVRQVVDSGLAGLEYFLGVPGTLGGAIYNNAHYLESLIGDHVFRVEVYNPQSHSFTWLNQAECDFGYDSSRFHHTKEVIVTIQFLLAPGSKETSMQLIKEATQYRAGTQPLGQPSSGCIFQNVPNNDHLRKLFPQFINKKFVPGGFLIDQAGLKGERQGDIMVSDIHAAFFVNLGNGTAADVKKLVEKVKNRVKETFGVDLREEVFYLS